MKSFSNTPSFNELPKIIPVFPLNGSIILPGADLPLHIFEERYRQMVSSSLKSNRIIGMIQPSESGNIDLYKIGCIGRIVSFKETNDGRYFLTLNGICRFEFVKEINNEQAFRSAEVSYESFHIDYTENQENTKIFDREKVFPLLKKYFSKSQIDIDMETLETFSDDTIIQSLSMSCPFEPSEKQLLLEAKNIENRGELFLSLVEIAISLQINNDSKSLQ